MHRRAPVLICIALLAAPAVMAAEAAKPARGKAAGNLAPPPAPKSANAAGLRGPAADFAPKLILARPYAPSVTPLRLAPLAKLSGATPFAGDRAAECRRTCASTHYVCLADPDRDDCSSVWGQCVVACQRPASEQIAF